MSLSLSKIRVSGLITGIGDANSSDVESKPSSIFFLSSSDDGTISFILSAVGVNFRENRFRLNFNASLFTLCSETSSESTCLSVMFILE